MERGIAVGVVILLYLAAIGGIAIGTAAADGDEPGLSGERNPDDDARPEDDDAWINETMIEDDEWREKAPYVDAGLDQEGYVGSDVILDGAGTWDDQDDIVHKEWTIETPSGGTIQPECPTCWFTTFNPSEGGEYAVTLEVRDSEGYENNDTLYVEVAVPELGESKASASAGGSGGCFAAHAAGGDESACGATTHVMDLERSDAGGTTHYVFERGDHGFVKNIDGAETNDEGQLVIPAQNVKEQWTEAHRENQSSSNNNNNYYENKDYTGRKVVDAMGYGGSSSSSNGGGSGGGSSCSVCYL